MLNLLDALSGAVFSEQGSRRVEDEYAVAVVVELLRFTDRARVVFLFDQEKPIKKLADLVRDNRKHDTVLLNTLVGSSASAGCIERASQGVAKQCRTLRSRKEEEHAIQLDMLILVRHAAWLMTHFQIKADGKTGMSESGSGRPVLGSSGAGRSGGAGRVCRDAVDTYSSDRCNAECRRCAACTSRSMARAHMLVARAQAKVHSTECRVRFEASSAQEDPAPAKVEEPAAVTAQASSSSSAPAGLRDAGVPLTDLGGPAPLVRQDEVSATEETSNTAVTEPMQGVVVAAEHENKRQRTCSGLLTARARGGAVWRIYWVSLRNHD